MDKIFIEHTDYLPEGWTFERINEILDKKGLELTRENLAKIVTEEALNLTEDDIIKMLAETPEFKNAHVHIPQTMGRPRMTYGEGLNEDDELNQEFPKVDGDE